MAREVINNGESGLVVRNKLNNMTDELYQADADLQSQVDDKSDSTHSHDGAYEPKDAAIQEHIQSAHAPADANNYQHPVSHPHTMISGLGTAATRNVGTANGQLLESQDGKAPPVDGSQLTNIQGSSITETADAKVLTAQERSDIESANSHRASTANPHSVTKAQVGLGSADDTSDADKPVSTAQQAALDLKSDETHNHDLDYATADHNHDLDYAAADHNHDLGYAAADHDHDLDYDPLGSAASEASSAVTAHEAAYHSGGGYAQLDDVIALTIALG